MDAQKIARKGIFWKISRRTVSLGETEKAGGNGASWIAVRQHAGNKIPENMPSKATVSRKDYHGGHGGTRRKARGRNTSRKAADKCRIVHKRMRKEEDARRRIRCLLLTYLLPLLLSSVYLRALCGSFFRLVGILFPASCLSSPLKNGVPLC